MKPLTKKILKGYAGALLLLLFLGLLLPCSNCPKTAARRAVTWTFIQNFDAASRAYKAEYGIYPLGSLREVVFALTGKNPRNIIFLAFPKSDLNQAGELIDSWKTPFRLARVSDAKRPQLISAGQDKAFGTPDDITLTNQGTQDVINLNKQ